MGIDKDKVKRMSESIRGVKADISDLLTDVKRLSDLPRTFSNVEADAIIGKLDRATDQLTAAKAGNDGEASSRVNTACNIILSAQAMIMIEIQEFRRAVIDFKAEAEKKNLWQQYERDVERTHEKFIAVADLITGILKIIP